jgi:hypothetical protein
MRHNVGNYTESDLTVALQSPFVPQSIKDEIEVELNKRKYDWSRDMDQVRVHNLK